MKLNEKQITRLAQLVLSEWKNRSIASFKDKDEKVVSTLVSIVKKNMQDEVALDQEVNKMMDDLERQNPGSFQRYKMFPLLKKRLAKEKGFVL